ncbi:non-specific lipid-transfer protein-like protein, partial [Dorcoceras hygrometricum]
CTALAALMGSSKDCFCQMAAGNIPSQIPINQTLAISLPRACNMPGVPLECKGSSGNPAGPSGASAGRSPS